MKQEKGRYYSVIFLIVAVASTASVGAQEFRGFYGNSRELITPAPSSRYYRSGRSANNNSGYILSKRNAYNYERDAYYPDEDSYQLSTANRSAYPAPNLIINIFPADYTRTPGKSEYYNRSRENNYYNIREIANGFSHLLVLELFLRKISRRINYLIGIITKVYTRKF